MADVTEVLDSLQRLAPTWLAGSWDNVGLLVRGRLGVQRIGVCIDLTDAVYEELASQGCDFIVAYHPPIFGGLKRLVGANTSQRVVMRALAEGRHIYAPHTALDAATGGMGEWLAEGLGAATDVRPIEPNTTSPEQGMGRRGELAPPTTVRALLPRLKEHLGLEHVRVAGALDVPRTSFAVCPGAGGSLFEKLRGIDLYVTGEMRHHDVLAKVAAGASVILTDHTNTERGYLPKLKVWLEDDLDVEVVVSTIDVDPLSVC
jgi:dinuclear metal center YbgI/SA1388 family protein